MSFVHIVASAKHPVMLRIPMLFPAHSRYDKLASPVKFKPERLLLLRRRLVSDVQVDKSIVVMLLMLARSVCNAMHPVTFRLLTLIPGGCNGLLEQSKNVNKAIPLTSIVGHLFPNNCKLVKFGRYCIPEMLLRRKGVAGLITNRVTVAGSNNLNAVKSVNGVITPDTLAIPPVVSGDHVI